MLAIELNWPVWNHCSQHLWFVFEFAEESLVFDPSDSERQFYIPPIDGTGGSFHTGPLLL